MYGNQPQNFTSSEMPYAIYYYPSSFIPVNPEQVFIYFDPSFGSMHAPSSIAENNCLPQEFQQEAVRDRSQQRDQDYVDVQGIKQPNRKQVQGRNIHSNIFRSFLKYLSSQHFLGHQFNLIKTKHKISMDESGFKTKVKMISRSFKNYIKKTEFIDFIYEIMQNERKEEEKIILRIMIEYYCRNVHILTAFSSNKVHNKSIKFHLRELRFLIQHIDEAKSTLRKNNCQTPYL